MMSVIGERRHDDVRMRGDRRILPRGRRAGTGSRGGPALPATGRPDVSRRQRPRRRRRARRGTRPHTAPAGTPASAPWRPGCRPSSPPPSGRRSRCATSGIIASTAAAAVSTIGRKRRTVAPTIGVPAARRPAAMSCSIWSTRMTELRMMMPDSAIVPSIATKPNGMPNTSSAGGDADQPQRRGQHAPSACARSSAAGSSAASAPSTSISGTPAAIDRWPRAESSTAPPISIR